MSNKSISYFKGLNGLRFIAALFVVVSHVELIKSAMGVKNNYTLMEQMNLGGLGVYFFFVLSGFLITYLLLKEKNIMGTVAIKKFYLRRVFRIWPLYFFVLILGFFVLPQFHAIDLIYNSPHFKSNYYENLLLYILILPNLAFSIFPAVPHIGQSWSIGVEEQFYLFWPILIKKINNIFNLIIFSFIGIILFKIVLLFFQMQYPSIKWLLYFKTFIAMSKFESMMIGAIGAWFFFQNQKSILKFIYHPITFWISVLFFFPLNYFTFYNILQNGIHIPISIMFIIIILNVSTNSKCIVNLENRVFNYLGSISYGIYMYHLIIIPILIYLVKLNFTCNGFFANAFIYFGSILGSILFASLSFKYFETPLLKIKTRYEVK